MAKAKDPQNDNDSQKSILDKVKEVRDQILFFQNRIDELYNAAKILDGKVTAEIKELEGIQTKIITLKKQKECHIKQYHAAVEKADRSAIDQELSAIAEINNQLEKLWDDAQNRHNKGPEFRQQGEKLTMAGNNLVEEIRETHKLMEAKWGEASAQLSYVYSVRSNINRFSAMLQR